MSAGGRYHRDMGGTGFWVFLAIIVINLVIQVVRKSAEKRALKAAAGPLSSPSAAQSSGEFEVVLERVGDARLEVVKLLRGDLGFSLQGAMTAVEEAPTVLVRGVARGPAGMLRSRLEAVGASASIRRSDEGRSGARPTSPRSPTGDASAEPSPPAVPTSIEIAARNVLGAGAFEAAKKAWEERIEALRTPSVPSAPTPSRSPAVSDRGQAKSRASAKRSPSPEAAGPSRQAKQPARSPAVDPVARALPAVQTPLAGPGATSPPDLSRLLGRQGLREAFIVQELLRPPLALRSGMGGRDS